MLQAGARARAPSDPGQGLTGAGYDGHTFWDTETFVLPVLTYTVPDAAPMRCAGGTHADLARERAASSACAAPPSRGARSAAQECSGYWPAGTAAFHVNADIADAVARYADATGDETFERESGLELLVHTARLWSSLGHHDAAGRSGSTASPGRTSTARSPTTTSTRT